MGEFELAHHTLYVDVVCIDMGYFQFGLRSDLVLCRSRHISWSEVGSTTRNVSKKGRTCSAEL